MPNNGNNSFATNQHFYNTTTTASGSVINNHLYSSSSNNNTSSSTTTNNSSHNNAMFNPNANSMNMGGSYMNNSFATPFLPATATNTASPSVPLNEPSAEDAPSSVSAESITMTELLAQCATLSKVCRRCCRCGLHEPRFNARRLIVGDVNCLLTYYAV
jgi:hypothetical protein